MLALGLGVFVRSAVGGGLDIFCGSSIMTDELTLFSVRSVFAPLVAGTGTVPITLISSETFSFLLSGDSLLVGLRLLRVC